jgi:hypothetical protein
MTVLLIVFYLMECSTETARFLCTVSTGNNSANGTATKTSFVPEMVRESSSGHSRLHAEGGAGPFNYDNHCVQVMGGVQLGFNVFLFVCGIVPSVRACCNFLSFFH